MESVCVTDLKRRANTIIKRVREKNEVVNVTYRGKVVARIVPSEGKQEQHTRTDPCQSEDLEELVAHIQREKGRPRAEPRAQIEARRASMTEEERRSNIEATLAEGRRLRDEIGKWVTDPVDAVELVREQRRDLGDVRS